jgi:branched-subunit amino acid aminotransferase/4-amino-4-deoxychorismate lyase
MDFYLQKGKIVSDNDFNPKAEWKNYPVTFSVPMWFAHGEIPCFDLHIRDVKEKLQLLHRALVLEPDDILELRRLFLRLINKNKAYMGGWLYLEIFAGDKGWTYVASVKKSLQREIPYDDQGKLAIVAEVVYPENPDSLNFQLFSEKFWIAESLKITGSRYGEAIFCNARGVIVSAIGANLFCIVRDRLFTPSLNTGCPADNFRDLTLASSIQAGLEIIETDSLRPEDLLTMDELFTVSERAGFKWIMGIGTKRFVRKRSELIRNTADFLLWKDRKKQDTGN